MSKLFKQSLENMDGEAEVTQEDQLAQIADNLMDAQREIQEAQEITEQVERAETTEETLERMEAAETAEEKVEIATESLLKIIGYPKAKKFSLESFSGEVQKVSTIAMEGLGDKVVESVKRMFTSNSAIIAKLEAGVAKLEEKGSKEEAISSPAWAKPLVTKAQSTYSVKDVTALVTMLDKQIDSGAIAKLVDEVQGLVGKVLSAKSDSSKWTDPIVKIKTATEKLMKEAEAVLTKVEMPGSVKSTPDFTPIKAEEASKLVAFVKESILADKSPLNGAYSALTDSTDYVTLNTLIEAPAAAAVKAVAKSVDDKNQQARQFARVLGSVKQEVAKLINVKYKVAYAIVRYIESSVK
jgi:hypothetical protein